MEFGFIELFFNIGYFFMIVLEVIIIGRCKWKVIVFVGVVGCFVGFVEYIYLFIMEVCYDWVNRFIDGEVVLVGV